MVEAVHCRFHWGNPAPGLSIEGFGVIKDTLIIEMGWVVPRLAVTGLDQLCQKLFIFQDAVTSQYHRIGYLSIPLILKHGWTSCSFVEVFPIQILYTFVFSG